MSRYIHFTKLKHLIFFKQREYKATNPIEIPSLLERHIKII
jgi:hypothetical protein